VSKLLVSILVAFLIGFVALVVNATANDPLGLYKQTPTNVVPRLVISAPRVPPATNMAVRPRSLAPSVHLPAPAAQPPALPVPALPVKSGMYAVKEGVK
jgi:hypothetical protein